MNMLMNEGLNETETTSNVCWMVLSLTSVSQLFSSLNPEANAKLGES